MKDMRDMTKEEIENRIRELGRILEECKEQMERCEVVLAYWENQDLKSAFVWDEIKRIDNRLKDINHRWNLAEDEMYDLGKELFCNH